MSPSEHFTAEFHSISAVIRRRRTCKEFNGRPIAKDILEALLELAVWAPNHKLTEPWKFRVATESGLQSWVRYLRDQLTDTELVPFEKALEKMSKAGAIIYVTNLTHDDPVTNAENYAATSAAIQNILLAATAQHLQSYWSTSKVMSHKKTIEFLNIGDDETFVGALWIGHGESPPPKTRKLAREKTLWIK